MDNVENTTRPSGLRPPSQISCLVAGGSDGGIFSKGAGLQEISDSQNNVRANPPATMLPLHQGHKRQNTGNFGLQPEPKRKTLAERGAEPIGTKLQPPTTISRSISLKGASIAKLAADNKPPTSMAASSRHTSSNSFSSSVSGFTNGIGPTSRLSGRPPTNGFAQSVNGRQRSNTRSRPATAMGSHGMDATEGKQQNGTKLPVSHSRSRGIQNRRLRGYASTQSMDAGYQRDSKRDVSISTQFQKLSIRDQVDAAFVARGQVSSGQEDLQPEYYDGPSSHPHQSGVQKGNVASGQGIIDEVARPKVFCSTESPAHPTTAAGAGTRMEPPRTPSRSAQDMEEAVEALGRTIQTAKRKSVPAGFQSPCKSLTSPTKQKQNPLYLTKETTSVTNFTAWNIDERLHGIESQFLVMKATMDVTLTDKKTLEEAVEQAKTRASDLERERSQLSYKNDALEHELDSLRKRFQAQTLELETSQRAHKYEVEDRSREHRIELQELRREFKDEAERMGREHSDALDALTRHHRAELEDERAMRVREVQELQLRLGSEQQDMGVALLGKEREMQSLRAQLEEVRSELARERALRDGLQRQAGESAAVNIALEERNRALRLQVEFLESDSKQQSDSFASMEARLQEALRQAEAARQKLIKEETERRVLFNKYQELRGNIRVMCRVRPVLEETAEGEAARLVYPDCDASSTQIDVTGPEEKSSLGNVTRKVTPFEFDRVFPPATQNEEVFDEIAQLVQSALDGYNVCIFAYGQTGSGKTYTMSSEDGMIRRATHMIYDTVERLREKSWEYAMEGSFVEVYNEELHDLLAPASGDGSSGNVKKKLEIRHDEARRQTMVTGCRVVPLDSPDTVQTMLAQAQRNRSVAATKANERSSRSHSVFTLRLCGRNSATGARCEGTLNLVDLAGSERLKQSGAEGERMRETQSINRSLACLGDVIEALGRAAAGNGGGGGGQGGTTTHIPYRNSKLTHLLQYSLGGNSKTLMFVMVSPLEAHLRETLTSLRFATKVHNTHIGTAKTTKRIKDKERTSES